MKSIPRQVLLYCTAIFVVGCADPLDLPISRNNNNDSFGSDTISTDEGGLFVNFLVSSEDKEALKSALSRLRNAWGYIEFAQGGTPDWYEKCGTQYFSSKLVAPEGTTYRDILSVYNKHSYVFDSLSDQIEITCYVMTRSIPFTERVTVEITPPQYMPGAWQIQLPVITITNRDWDVFDSVDIAWELTVDDRKTPIARGYLIGSITGGLERGEEFTFGTSPDDWNEFKSEFSSALDRFGNGVVRMRGCMFGMDREGLDERLRKAMYSWPRKVTVECLDIHDYLETEIARLDSYQKSLEAAHAELFDAD